MAIVLFWNTFFEQLLLSLFLFPLLVSFFHFSFPFFFKNVVQMFTLVAIYGGD